MCSFSLFLFHTLSHFSCQSFSLNVFIPHFFVTEGPIILQYSDFLGFKAFGFLHWLLCILGTQLIGLVCSLTSKESFLCLEHSRNTLFLLLRGRVCVPPPSWMYEQSFYYVCFSQFRKERVTLCSVWLWDIPSTAVYSWFSGTHMLRALNCCVKADLPQYYRKTPTIINRA